MCAGVCARKQHNKRQLAHNLAHRLRIHFFALLCSPTANVITTTTTTTTTAAAAAAAATRVLRVCVGRSQPMKKQGSIILGIGGDNSDSAIGTCLAHLHTLYCEPVSLNEPNAVCLVAAAY